MSANNTSYGTGALHSNYNGKQNTAIGAYSNYYSADAEKNTSVGCNSMFLNTTGNNNTSVGAGSMCNNDEGMLNTAVGSSALEGLTQNQSVGDQNVAIGAQALYSNQGNQSTAVGTFALLNNTTGSLNTAIGTNSGLNNYDGNYNTFLGPYTDVSSNSTVNYSTAIGYGAIIDASNQIVLGGTGAGSYPTVIVPGPMDASAIFLPGTKPYSHYQENEVVPKSYVDVTAAGLKPKVPCSCVATEGVDISGPTGLNVNYTFDTLYTIDGYTTKYGDRVLINNQGNTASPYYGSTANGIYVVSGATAVTGPYNWTRSFDMPVGADALSAYTFIEGGDTYAKSSWVQANRAASGTTGTANVDPAVVGTDPLLFVKFTGVDFKIGRGLSLETFGNYGYLDVNTDLNFINYLDSVIPSLGGPTGATGTLNIGTNTTYDVNIGKTALNNYINFWSGITGPTGSFTQVLVSGNESIQGTLGVTGTSTLYGQISAPGGITGTTGSFTYLKVSQNEVIQGTLGVTGTSTLYGQVSAPGGITGTTGSFTYLKVSQNEVIQGTLGVTGTSTLYGQVSAPGGITGTTGSFTYLNTSESISGKTGSFTYLTISQNEIIQGTLGVTGTSTLYGQISAPGGITGATGSFTYLTISQNEVIQGTLGVTGTSTLYGQVSAPAGITGATGTFTQLLVSGNEVIQGTLGVTGQSNLYGQVSAPAGITGSTGTFTQLLVSGNEVIQGTLGVTGTSTLYGQISAPAGITGATGSFTYLKVSQNELIGGTLGVTGTSTLYGQISAPGGITGATGSFTYLKVSQNELIGGTLGVTGTSTLYGQVSAPGGITGTTGSFTYLAHQNLQGQTGTFTYLNVTSTLGVTGTSTLYGQVSAPGGITGSTGSFRDISANRISVYDLSVNHLITIGTSTTNLSANTITTSGNLGVTGTSTLYGNVGIGKGATGTYALDVSGNVNVDGVVNSGNYVLYPTGQYPAYIKVGTFSAASFPYQAGQGIHFKFYFHNGYNAFNTQDYICELFFKLSNGSTANEYGVKANSFYYVYGGNIGNGNIGIIGTTVIPPNPNPSPVWYATDSLELTFDLYIYSPFYNDYSFYEVYYTDGCSWTNNPAGYGLPSVGSDPSFNATEEYILQTPTTFNGNVGIGKGPTGTYALDVSGNIHIGPTGYGIIFPDGSIQYSAFGTGSTGSSQWTTDGTSIYYNKGPVNVGSTLGVTGTSTLYGLVSAPGGITGSTGSFTNISANRISVYDLSVNHLITIGTSTTNLSANTITTSGNLGVTGTSTLYGQVYAQGGITGATASFSYISTTQAISGQTGSFTNLRVTQNEVIQGTLGVTGTSALYGNVGIGKGATGTYALDVLGNVNVGGVVNSGNYILMNNGDASGNVRVGTFKIPDSSIREGQGIHFKFYTHVGFNTANAEDYIFELYFKLADMENYPFAANSFYYRYGQNDFNPNPVWYVTDYPTQKTFDLYITIGPYNYCSFYEVYYTNGCTWTDSPAVGLPSGYPSLNATEEYILQTPTTFNGNVGIGIGPSSSYALDVSGSIYIGPSASANGIIFQDGTKQTSAYTSSDYRIKQNIVPLNNTYSTDNLNPVTYHNIQLGKQDIGLIAHELQEVYPMLVNGEKDGECMQTINYVGLIPIIIKEIQDLKKKLQVLMEDKNK